MKVLNVTGEVEEFQPKRIKNKILEETDLSEEEADKIKTNVVRLIHKKYQEEISTSTIRSLINNQLVNKGYVAEEENTRKLGMSVADFKTSQALQIPKSVFICLLYSHLSQFRQLP